MFNNRKRRYVVGIVLVITAFLTIPLTNEIIADKTLSKAPSTEEVKKWDQPFSRNEHFNKDKSFSKEVNVPVNPGFFMEKEPKGGSPLPNEIAETESIQK